MARGLRSGRKRKSSSSPKKTEKSKNVSASNPEGINPKKRKKAKPTIDEKKKEVITDNNELANEEKIKDAETKVQNIKYNKCTQCKQKLGEIKTREKMPKDAVDEVVALADKKLSLITDENFFDDFRPTYKLVNFSVYDANEHLCRFDTGLIEANVYLYCCGTIVPIYDGNASDQKDFDDGVLADKIGPINEWYMSGFDGGPNQPIGISTPFAEYYLVQPADSYKEFMEPVVEKMYLTKVVIEFLYSRDNPTYEDLLDVLQTAELPKGVNRITEESLLNNAQFICNQVTSLDINSEEPDDQDFPLLSTSCMRSLIKLTNATLNPNDSQSKINDTSPVKKKSSQVILTKLIHQIVSKFLLKNQAQNKDIFQSTQPTNCGECKECKKPLCRTCRECKNYKASADNPRKRGGRTAKHKEEIKNVQCLKRKCLNKAIEVIKDDPDSDKDDFDETSERRHIDFKSLPEILSKMKNKNSSKKIEWPSSPIFREKNRIHYESCTINNEPIFVNDFVKIKSSQSIEIIAQIKSIWEENEAQKAHVNCFYNSRDTILGNLGDKTELFASDVCADIPLKSIDTSCEVNYREIPKNWADLGNAENPSYNDNQEISVEDPIYYYQMRYIAESGRFEHLSNDDNDLLYSVIDEKNSAQECKICQTRNEAEKFNKPQLFEPGGEIVSNNRLSFGCVLYRNEEYRMHTGVFINPSFVKFKYKQFTDPVAEKQKRENVDEEIYTEYYRKYSAGDHIKGSNYDTPEPFAIGCIKSINLVINKEVYYNINDNLNPEDIKLTVNKMYRAENTHEKSETVEKSDYNLVYWSNEECEIPFSAIAGKCQLFFGNLTRNYSLIQKPYVFYFTQAYDAENEKFIDPPDQAKAVNLLNDVHTEKSAATDECSATLAENVKVKPLRTLDIFSGCGGLSEGLSTSGVADVKWAIEKDSAAAKAFIKNHPNVQMFEGDCNFLLNSIFHQKNSAGLPKKGDIELLCGGPPCQGFSGLNRFNGNRYSHLKNALLFTFLSYCDYFRPKLVIMENVQNFAQHHKGLMLKLALYCFVQIGYQCTFAVLQAGNFGLPQARRRIILFAAAPGTKLPKYPEPLHVFSKRTCQLDVVIDGKKFTQNFVFKDSAPYKTVCVRDAIDDLPKIKNGDERTDIVYENDALSSFQRKMRRNKIRGDFLMDHVCKKMSPLVEARIDNIPKTAGADWRDLPNIVVELSDGSMTNKLEYRYKDSLGRLKGVCACAIGQKCDPSDRQENTLIPWCLPHTGNRQYGWAGTYGRLDWNGFFGTTVTNPEPLGKQGRILHPEQSRVVSVRECARSQGFPDDYCFHGSLVERYRQIGNAVPPPLAEAIGNEIKKVL